MINIRIKTVKPGSLPYNRVGDWHWEGDRLLILVNAMEDERHQWLIAVHELVEAFLCRINGITEEAIDRFDESVKGQWVAGGPGYREHLTSTGIESILAAMANVNWDKYEEEIDKSQPPKEEEIK